MAGLAIMISGCHGGAQVKTKPQTHQALAIQDAGTVTDIDGNTYRTIKIGDQVWMATNLKVTHYNNGDPIPHITDSSQWRKLTTGAWSAYDNDKKNIALYGLLYNWHTLADRRKLAPKGWHIPTDAEWRILMKALGGAEVAGGKMKAGKEQYWQKAVINEDHHLVNFGALPGGGRNNNGIDDNAGSLATWWSATTEAYADFAVTYNITSDKAALMPDTDDRACGFSIRCIKN